MNVEEISGSTTSNLGGTQAARDSQPVEAATHTQRTTQTAGRMDEASLSDRARQLARVRSEFDAIADVRAGKVEELRQRIKAGEYQINVSQLVDKLIGLFR